MSKSSPQVYDAFGPVPPHVAPSVPVRRWDQGLIAGGATFAATWCGSLWLGLHAPGADLGPWSWHATGAIATAYHWATMGISAGPAAKEYLAEVFYPVQTALRVGVPLALSVAVSAWVTHKALIPRSNTWHLSGPRLLEGKAARREARVRSLTPKQQEADRFHLALHPDLVLGKKHWSTGMLIYGSVGAGKTQILLGIIKQIIARNDKLFLYDFKGDFTAIFRTPIIVSPFDARSYVWDVARDVRTPTQAAAFAASLIPEEQGNGKFWTIAAQQILTGALRTLQNTKGTKWSWSDLADLVAQAAPTMLPMLQEHYAKAAPLIANEESQSTASILATLAGYTRVIDDLALAWPKRSKRSFAITDWIKDDYVGRNQVIVQSGQDPTLTRAYVSAMLNVAEPAINSPQLPDNEEGRSLAFIIDELPSIKIDVEPWVAKARSKGVVMIMACQDLAQLQLMMGPEKTKALSSMVGTHVIGKIQMGDSRDELAQKIGKHKVAWRNHEQNAQVHEESRSLVSPAELTDRLGLRKGKIMGPHGWGFRAIVLMGGDPLLLDFPGLQLPKMRVSQKQAKWTLGPAGGKPLPPASKPTPSQETEQVLGLTIEQVMAREAERLGFGKK